MALDWNTRGKIGVFCLIGMMALLAACGGGEDTPTTPDAETNAAPEVIGSRPADAPRRAAEVPDRFEFLRYAVNTESTTPELCLTFSKPLSPETDYSSYLAIEADIAVRVEGARLCLGGLTYGETRTLTLRAGLPGAEDEELPRDESITLTFDDRPAVVDFAGDGIILPRIDADGLGIQTVNVDEVQVVVRRVTDRALVFRSLTSGFRSNQGEYNYQSRDERPNELGVEVWRGRMETPGPLNATVTTVFPVIEAIGTLEPGAYYVEIDDAGAMERNERRPARAARWLMVTDLAFTAYRGATGLDVTVRSLQTAQPAAGIEVQLVARSNEVLATARTDGNGQVRFDAPLMNGTAGDAPRLLTAYGEQGDFAVLDLYRAPVDLSSQPVSGRSRPENADAYIYLDRGIYRPGETVHASLLLRDAAGRALTDRAGALALYQPNGIEQARIRFTDLVQAGGTAEQFPLPQAAARGMWRLAVEMDGTGTVGTKTFSVEDFVPQRVELTLEADDETPMRTGDTRMVEARARFLYGAPGAGLPMTGVARVQRDPNPYPDWAGFQFGLHSEQFAEVQFSLPEVAADGAGEANLPIAIETRNATSTLPLRIRTVIEVEEPGGRAVADDIRIPYRPRDTYFGIRPDFEGRAERRRPAAFQLVGVDTNGAAVTSDAQWRVVRRDYDYDWYRTDGGRWQWRRSERIVPIESGRVVFDGEAPTRIETPELDWGDYTLILSQDDEDLASYGFWVGWRGRTASGVEAPDEVRVAGPDDAPDVGDRATITLRAPYQGLAEVVVATDRILDTRQIEIAEAGAELTIPVTEDWGAGAYVMVTVYTPRDAVSQPRPRRAVGVAYVPVNVGDRTFEVSLDAPERVEPNQTLDLRLEATNGPRGEQVYATVAAVDEGILLLTGHSSPDPIDWFFGKARFSVSLHDDYGRLLDPNQGAAAPVRSGGDQIGGAGLSVVPTKSVALFSGSIELNRNGRASIPLELPDFNGELRLMTVVWSDSGMGATSQPMTVRDDVPAELILPRFLSPGDSAEATATLDNIDGPAGDYDITFTATGPVTIAEGEQSINLPQGERQDFGVNLSATEEGIAQLTLTAEGPRNTEVASTYPIQVRSAFWPESALERIVLRPGESYTPASDALAGYTPGSATLQVSVAATPIDISTLYQSLYRYPYACTEQLVSRTMPLLSAARLRSLGVEGGPDGAAAEIRDSIETLLSRQSAGGAFGLWRIGDIDASPWIGAYATDFITRAAAEGYPVPEAAVTRALDAMGPIAQGEFYRGTGYNVNFGNPQWTEDTRTRLQHRSSAYALYVLARNGRADRSRLRYMHDELIEQIESPLARAHIGAGLAALGDQGRARNAFTKALEGLGYRNDGDWYQTPRRDLAGVLALAAEAGFTDIVEDLTPRIINEVPEPRRLTTQEKAFMIYAASALAGDSDELAITYDGTADDASTVLFTDDMMDSAGTFTNSGNTPLWMSALSRGAPISPPKGDVRRRGHP